MRNQKMGETGILTMQRPIKGAGSKKGNPRGPRGCFLSMVCVPPPPQSAGLATAMLWSANC